MYIIINHNGRLLYIHVVHELVIMDAPGSGYGIIICVNYVSCVFDFCDFHCNFRGYYIRVKAINSLVSEFLNKQSCSLRTQIISLGAGFDTLFFRFRDKFAASNCQVVEVGICNNYK